MVGDRGPVAVQELGRDCDGTDVSRASDRRHRRAAGSAGAGADQRRCREDRRAHGYVEPLCGCDRQGLAHRRRDGGRRLRREGRGQAGRRGLGRSPEQARHRGRDRAQLVRQRQGRHDHGRADLLRRACRAADRARQEQAVHQLGRRLVRSHGRRLLAEFRALDLRHLRALECRGPRDGRRRTGQLVLPHGRLCVSGRRSSATRPAS